jgi:hypothetical protein
MQNKQETMTDPDGSFDDDNFALPDEMHYATGNYQPRPSKNIEASTILNNLVIDNTKPNAVVEVSSASSSNKDPTEDYSPFQPENNF